MEQQKEKLEVVYRRYDLPADFPLIALTGENWLSGPAPVTRVHFHNCVEVGLLLEGSGYVYTENKTYEIEAPAVTLIPPNTIHFTYARRGSMLKWNWLYFHMNRMCSDLSPAIQSEIEDFLQRLSGDCLLVPSRTHPELHRTLELIMDEMSRKNRDYRVAVQGLACTASVMLNRLSDTVTRPNRGTNKMISYIAPAIKYIDHHYAENIRIETLADECHLSGPHFRRLFKSVFGISPLEYIQNHRIERACELLYNSNYSITQIGSMTGFPATSSFERQFVRRYGKSPNQWRKKALSEENPKVTRYLEMDAER